MAANSGHVLLVPHPKFERPPDNTGGAPLKCRWPLGDDDDHRRKYTRTAARYVRTLHGKTEDGFVGVWCEHEAATTASESKRAAARWLHDIDVGGLMAESRDPATLLNSDPWIWSPGFIWSVCLQYRLGVLLPAANVCPGDLVVFGSSVDGKWRMDTVLTVNHRTGMFDLVRMLGETGSYATCVARTLAGHGLFRPVQGRPFRRGLKAPFSFAPVDTDGRVRKRVDITLLLHLLEKSGGGPPKPTNSAGLTRCTVRRGTVQEFWAQLAERTLSTNHALGVRFSHPLDERRLRGTRGHA